MATYNPQQTEDTNTVQRGIVFTSGRGGGAEDSLACCLQGECLKAAGNTASRKTLSNRTDSACKNKHLSTCLLGGEEIKILLTIFL